MSSKIDWNTLTQEQMAIAVGLSFNALNETAEKLEETMLRWMTAVEDRLKTLEAESNQHKGLASVTAPLWMLGGTLAVAIVAAIILYIMKVR